MISSLTLFSCSVSEVIKKKYRPGFYLAHRGENKSSVPFRKDTEKNTIQKENKKLNIAISSRKQDSVVPQLFLKSAISNDITNKQNFSDNVTASSITKKRDKSKNQKNNFKTGSREIKQGFHPQQVFQSLPQDPPTASPKVIWQFTVAIICLLLCLLGILCIFGYSLLPALHFLVYVAAVFPETWFCGILFSIIGFFKYRKNPENIPAEPKPLNFFSRLAFILEIVELIDVPLIIVATFLALFSIKPLIVLVVLMFVMSLVSFVAGIIGLIKTLKDPKQSRNNIIKAILISLCSLIPVCLVLAWFIAVGTALVAALPYLAAALFILH